MKIISFEQKTNEKTMKDMMGAYSKAGVNTTTKIIIIEEKINPFTVIDGGKDKQ